mmetsp:Transcript_28269/g.78053  ORF Transcript_28269/g.78053 Transcript_28269/m.78053 type:complete len:128 (-) Transcript_28269:1293-1676(-)
MQQLLPAAASAASVALPVAVAPPPLPPLAPHPLTTGAGVVRPSEDGHVWDGVDGRDGRPPDVIALHDGEAVTYRSALLQVAPIAKAVKAPREESGGVSFADKCGVCSLAENAPEREDAAAECGCSCG